MARPIAILILTASATRWVNSLLAVRGINHKYIVVEKEDDIMVKKEGTDGLVKK